MENQQIVDTLEDLGSRVTTLEINFTNMRNEVSELKNTQLETQNILLRSNKEQNDLLNQIVTQTLGIKKVHAEGIWKTLGIVVGSGGIATVLIIGIMEIVKRFLIGG